MFTRFDLFHVHWPEYVFRGSTVPKAIVKGLIGVGILARMKLCNIPIVLTVHNRGAHEGGGRIEKALTRLTERLSVIRVYLNESEENDPGSGVVLLHTRYPNSANKDAERPESGTQPKILFFGQIRPYKGIESLIGAVSDSRITCQLTVAGLPIDSEYAREIEGLANQSTRIRLLLDHIHENELDSLITEADLIVLPYRYMYNSGAAIKALSEARPILVPRTSSTMALRREVGSEWISTFDSPLEAASLEAAIATARSVHGEPNLSRRDPKSIGALHESLYRIVLRGRRRSLSDWTTAVRKHVSEDREFVEHSFKNALP